MGDDWDDFIENMRTYPRSPEKIEQFKIDMPYVPAEVWAAIAA